MSGAGRAAGGYASLARVSNLPTCVTNVLVGAAVGAAALDGVRVAAVSAAIMLLYVGGMALNDLVDRDVDRQERPNRPLPSGRVTVAGAQRFIWVCLTAGLGITAILSPATFATGLVLVGAIVLYDLLHRRSPATVLLMGLCRALVYVVAAAAAGGWPVPASLAWYAGAMGLYVVALSVVARIETAGRPARRFRLSLVLPVIAVAPAGAHWPPGAVAIAAAAAVAGWIVASSRRLRRDPPEVGATVQGWLAGICLVDGLWLVLLERPAAAAVAAACFVATVIAHRTIPGT